MTDGAPMRRRLRIAAVLAVVQGIAHGTLLLFAKPRHGDSELAVIDAMQRHYFDFAGSMRSYWDFYVGYGIEAAGVCLVEGALLLLLARGGESERESLRPILVLIMLANIAHLLLMARFFFYIPAIFDLAVTTCVGWALLSARPTHARVAR